MCVYTVLLFCPRLCSFNPQSDMQTVVSETRRNTQKRKQFKYLSYLKKEKEEKEINVDD